MKDTKINKTDSDYVAFRDYKKTDDFFIEIVSLPNNVLVYVGENDKDVKRFKISHDVFDKFISKTSKLLSRAKENQLENSYTNEYKYNEDLSKMKLFTIRDFYSLCCLPEKIRNWDIYEKHKADLDHLINEISIIVQKLSDEPEKEVNL